MYWAIIMICMCVGTCLHVCVFVCGDRTNNKYLMCLHVKDVPWSFLVSKHSHIYFSILSLVHPCLINYMFTTSESKVSLQHVPCACIFEQSQPSSDYLGTDLGTDLQITCFLFVFGLRWRPEPWAWEFSLPVRVWRGVRAKPFSGPDSSSPTGITKPPTHPPWSTAVRHHFLCPAEPCKR